MSADFLFFHKRFVVAVASRDVNHCSSSSSSWHNLLLLLLTRFAASRQFLNSCRFICWVKTSRLGGFGQTHIFAYILNCALSWILSQSITITSMLLGIALSSLSLTIPQRGPCVVLKIRTFRVVRSFWYSFWYFNWSEKKCQDWNQRLIIEMGTCKSRHCNKPI